MKRNRSHRPRRRKVLTAGSHGGTELQSQVLCIDANFEPITQAGYLHRTSYLYPKLKNMGFNLVFCSASDDNRQNVASHAAASGIIYLTGEGHGADAQYDGQRFESVFKVAGYQPKEVQGRIVHFLSCYTAIKLGPDMVRNGCRAFFGYDFLFSFHPDFADVSLKCDSEIDLAFAEGLTAAEVFSRVQDLFTRTIADLRAIGGTTANCAAAMLETDLAHLVSPISGPDWGDQSAKLG
jgi:hypothetical protein